MARSLDGSDTKRLVDSSGDDSRTSLSLLGRVRLGDTIGWGKLYALYGPLVYQWCRAARWNEHDSADLVQEVFSAVHRKMDDFRRDRPGDTFRGWLRTITANKMRDRWRLKQRQTQATGGSVMLRRLHDVPQSHEVGETTDQHSDGDDQEVSWLYRRALELVRSEFDAGTWNAFWQVVVENRAPVDVASDLGISRNAVYIAKSRVLSRLRSEFGEVID